MFVVRVNVNHMAKVKRLFNNFGGTRVKVPQSLRSSDLYLRAVTAIFIYLNLHVMRVTDKKFTITNAQVTYWQKIHGLHTTRIERHLIKAIQPKFNKQWR